MPEDKDLVKYDVTEEALATYRKEFLPLTIKGLDDHEGYEAVKKARLFLRGERTNVEKRRVEFKAKALEYGRAVDSEAKRITTAIEEVEDHLMAEQKKIDDESARIKFEKEQSEKLPGRLDKLKELGAITSAEDAERYADEIFELDDTGFADLVNRIIAENLEKQRLAQEETERKQKAERERIEAEKKAIEDKRLEAEREEQHKADIAAAEKKAAEDARIQAGIDAKRKEDERIAQEAREKAERERIEAERPDKEKLEYFAEFFIAIEFPDVTSKKAQGKLTKVEKLVAQIVEELKAA